MTEERRMKVETNSGEQSSVQQRVVITPAKKKVVHSQTVMSIRTVCAWITITSAAVFAFISILAIWDVFGKDTGDIVGRAFSSLVIIGFAALIIGLISPMLDKPEDSK